MNKPDSIVVLTGAGISAESGLQTFRAEDGLWCDHRVEDVATPEGFARDPALVHAFYNMRRAQLRGVEPNAAHHALAKLAAEFSGDFLLVTQNVDNLHGRAHAMQPPQPSFRLIHMHGELTKAQHLVTGAISEWEGDMAADGAYRPHIVWFGEMPLEMHAISRALQECDLFISIGTSGNVYLQPDLCVKQSPPGRIRLSLILSHLPDRIFSMKRIMARPLRSCLLLWRNC